MIQGDEVRAQITAFYGVQRVDDGDWQTMQPPEMPDWREIDPAPVEPPLGPEFAQHMEFRPTGLLPFAGADERRASGWIRPKVAPELTGPAYIALLADTFWPAFYSTQEMPRPAATVMFMMEFFDDLVPGDNAPVFFRSHSPAARGGYTMEQREIWTPDGRLLALNQQSVCMIR
jgi:acyl-CoA thioesterase